MTFLFLKSPKSDMIRIRDYDIKQSGLELALGKEAF